MERPIIYVKRITNLSDARYCAGMGADLLGFVASPGHEDYVSPEVFNEIMGWVSGPRRVVELTELPANGIQDIILSYAPDLIHLTGQATTSLLFPDFPTIIEPQDKVTIASMLHSKIEISKVEFIVFAPGKTDSEWSKIKDARLLIAPGKDEVSISSLLQQTGVGGLMLEGSRELKPGLKDYDHLSRVLEELDF